MKSKIYMTAVDTGWINDEKPVELAAKHHQKHNFQVSQLGVCQVYFCQIDFSFSIMHFIIDIHTLSHLPSLSLTHTHNHSLFLSHALISSPQLLPSPFYPPHRLLLTSRMLPQECSIPLSLPYLPYREER